MTNQTAARGDIALFLRAHPPFDVLDERTLERVATGAGVECYSAGSTIFSQGAEPVEHLLVVRRGAVEIVHDGRVLDLLGEGELFGHASMLSGLPTGFEARAAEDTELFRIPADVARELLAAPAGLRFVARSLLELAIDVAGVRVPASEPTHQPVSSLLRTPPAVCPPHTPIQDAAQLMSNAGASCLVVELGNGSLGIVTDRDLRTRVLAEGLSGEAPVSAAMSAPAITCAPDRIGSEVLLDMLDHGLRHFPVVSSTGKILGVIEDIDLVAVHARSSFILRRRIARAQSVQELIAVSSELPPMVIALHEAQVAVGNVMAIYSVVVDALTRRLLELAVQESGDREASYAWLALGSQARREAMPSSDVDSAIVWFGDIPEQDVRPYLHRVGQRVTADLERCGFRSDEHGASASNRLFVRSLESWQHAGRSWIADPTQEKALILTSVLVDSRPVWGVHTGTPVADTFRLASDRPALLRLLARFALSHRPPTGFLRGLVVEHGGEHRGTLDLKHGGMLPIVDLARWAGMTAGVTSASTPERLRAAGDRGTLSAADAHTLQDAFELISTLRMHHQVQQLRAGHEPDDHVDPASLSALTRGHLKEAFRAVASIQKRVAAQLTAGVR